MCKYVYRFMCFTDQAQANVSLDECVSDVYNSYSAQAGQHERCKHECCSCLRAVTDL